MIVRSRSTSPALVSVAIRAGMPTFDFPHKTASTLARDRRRPHPIRGDRHQESTFHRAIIPWGRIAVALHSPDEDNPDRPSRLQSP